MVHRPLVLATALIAALGLPASADEALLRRAFGTFMKSAEELRIEAIPDLHEGGYARISVWGRRVVMSDGLKVDEAAIRLVGVSLDLEALRGGRIRVLDARDRAMQTRVLVRSLQDYFNAGQGIDDARVWVEDGYLLGTASVSFQGRPTRMRLKGFFAVSGSTEVYFYIETLHANGMPVLTAVIRGIEKQINPVVHQRDWPVTFRLRSLRLDAHALTVSTQGDGACPTCGGGDQPAIAP